jgi:four helix bundle protein
MVRTHKDLEVWKSSMDFVISIYKITSTFPTSEIYGLTSQIRRAAVSVPSNIAEGAGRKNTKEFIQFLYISLGSLAEIETQLEIASRLMYLKDTKDYQETIDGLRKMLAGLIHALKKKL